MGITVLNGEFGTPYSAEADARHKHLPFWYDVKIQNTLSPMEAWMQLGMMVMFPFMPPAPDLAHSMRREMKNGADFIAQRMGLKPDLTFKIMEQGEDGLRFAFASLSTFKRFHAGMNRLDHGSSAEASNDPDLSHTAGTLSLLPNARITANAHPAVYVTKPAATLETFEVKGLRAANNKHVFPKAKVLAFKG